ncbi:hypothetical protein CGZ96_08470 [Enemella evansiae]|uniref:hypothetical protein n=1 Tax=Enemella evansiae TaxID=2016499 RepID=UPI000B96CE34|nr:hypothetical protein [Enemella evansiae]OYN99243.1 hypothetical protein CGZ96_08470 [Enemella evansiae]
MFIRSIGITVAALAATLVTGSGVAYAADSTPPRGSHYAKVEQKTNAALRGQGLANRNLPQCDDLTSAPAAPAMRTLDYMAGEWVGYGWNDGQQGRSYYVQTEEIRFLPGGTRLEVKGTGTSPTDPSVTVFSAYAIAEPKFGGGISWTAYNEGNQLVADLVVTPTGWSWQFPAGPGVTVRYVTDFTDNWRAWHEYGEVSLDGGQTWQRFQQMTLVKTCDA